MNQLNQPANPAPEENMVEKILGDARAEAERATKSAERSIEAERRKAESEAEKARQEILDRIRKKAEALRAKEIATAKIESKRVLLKAREQAIGRVLDKIAEALSQVRADRGEYAKSLQKLATEAVSALDLPKVKVRISPEDAALADSGFVKDVTADVKAATGKDVEIEVEEDEGLKSGGCIAASEDGRIIFDNTFSRRLERLKPELRSLIAREVIKD